MDKITKVSECINYDIHHFKTSFFKVKSFCQFLSVKSVNLNFRNFDFVHFY